MQSKNNKNVSEDKIFVVTTGISTSAYLIKSENVDTVKDYLVSLKGGVSFGIYSTNKTTEAIKLSDKKRLSQNKHIIAAAKNYQREQSFDVGSIKFKGSKIYLSEFISSLANYLNEKEYNVSTDKISRFLKMFNVEDVDFSQIEDVEAAAKTCFCSNAAQYMGFNETFKYFCTNYSDIKEMQKLKKDNDKIKAHNANENQSYNEKIRNISISISERHNEITEQHISKIQDDIDSASEFLEQIKNYSSLNQSLAEKIQSGYWSYIVNVVDEETIEKEINEVFKVSRELLCQKDINGFMSAKKYYDLLKKLKTKTLIDIRYSYKLDSVLNTKLREKQIYEERLEQNKLKEKELNEKLSKLIQKLESVNNRPEFITAGNSVQSLSPGVIVPFDKNFKSLSSKEKASIYKYIKDNIEKFKTRVARSIHCQNMHNIDMQNTIAQACRTAGLPMNIIYQKPHMNKTNLILVLDVSGSCKDASEMMLTFMYTLKEVFPRGCKAFAFINSLYDISSVLQASNMDAAIKEVLSSIPRHGAYSNYCIPITQLWEEHRNEITPDSIVIFIGDARNNKNDTAEECFKNISRRAKKCYWLNTEAVSKWDTFDSVINVYSQYAKVFEACNPGQIMDFITQM